MLFRSQIMNERIRNILLLDIALIIASCANRGVGPQGGPKDEIPPKILKEEPLNGSVNQHSKIINITFDEIVQLDNIADNLLISPPQKTPPTVKSFAKKVRVSFDDDLKDSTTYTIDFGNAIVDNNEKNPLRNYTFSFSTGETIDTLQISGKVINAENLNPISGIYVGIHRDLSDSVFSLEPFDRIARTDSIGRFCIRNIHHGTYRLYALADANRDYKYQLGEGLAWSDSILTPTCHTGTLTDTVWFDEEIVDSIRRYQGTIYQPSDLMLRFSNEDMQRHYFMRAYRDKQHYFQLVFATPQDSLPIVKPIGQDSIWYEHSILQYSTNLDTITYWLTDSDAIKIDTIHLAMTYMKSDSVFELYPQTDTLKVVYRHPRENKFNKKSTPQNKTVRVEMKSNQSNSFDVYNPLVIHFGTPLTDIATDSIHLFQKIDTISKNIAFQLYANDSSHTSYSLIPATKSRPIKNELSELWEASQSYELRLDSGALHDIYGNTISAQKINWKTHSLDEYSSIKIILADFDSCAIIQLLDQKDNVVRSLHAKADGIVFKYLKPDSYFLRLYIDTDHNGKWSPALWRTHTHPEKVYYFPNKLTLRANWDFEETWTFSDYTDKPRELIKDQSKVKK